MLNFDLNEKKILFLSQKNTFLENSTYKKTTINKKRENSRSLFLKKIIKIFKIEY